MFFEIIQLILIQRSGDFFIEILSQSDKISTKYYRSCGIVFLLFSHPDHFCQIFRDLIKCRWKKCSCDHFRPGKVCNIFQMIVDGIYYLKSLYNTFPGFPCQKIFLFYRIVSLFCQPLHESGVYIGKYNAVIFLLIKHLTQHATSAAAGSYNCNDWFITHLFHPQYKILQSDPCLRQSVFHQNQPVPIWFLPARWAYLLWFLLRLHMSETEIPDSCSFLYP